MASIEWTADLIAERAAEYMRVRIVLRDARYAYRQACARFKDRRSGDFVDVADPAFRRATRKTYAAYQHARAEERNAGRRLETAVRGSQVFHEMCNDRRR
ncbi:hypothetical protein [Caballeronia sp. LZ032]|uniref:hypothetical protein n=1 Tax=Caballeronia sp. LZ032 TaxID=3038565 RepID=UPI002858F3D6|nr:hypothetical protein [Caballeronia sp. LZ032]MDR5878803.1 hypothetical protein [Caballeronia sp. LZ032]